MALADLAGFYRDYIDCLNRRDWRALDAFVAEDVEHNGRLLGVAGYRAMLERDYADIPDLRFNVDLLAVDGSLIAARLRFDCHPVGSFLGLPVNGKRVSFAENVFYRLENGRIRQVWSVIDKATVEAQTAES